MVRPCLLAVVVAILGEVVVALLVLVAVHLDLLVLLDRLDRLDMAMFRGQPRYSP